MAYWRIPEIRADYDSVYSDVTSFRVRETARPTIKGVVSRYRDMRDIYRYSLTVPGQNEEEADPHIGHVTECLWARSMKDVM